MPSFSVGDLKKRAIREFLAAWNEDPKFFVWTATVESIMEKLSRCRAHFFRAPNVTGKAREQSFGQILRLIEIAGVPKIGVYGDRRGELVEFYSIGGRCATGICFSLRADGVSPLGNQAGLANLVN